MYALQDNGNVFFFILGNIPYCRDLLLGTRCPAEFSSSRNQRPNQAQGSLENTQAECAGKK